jgi:hypothetical protein
MTLDEEKRREMNEGHTASTNAPRNGEKSAEADVLAEVKALVAAGVLREVDAEWVTMEVVAPGIETGFVIKDGACSHPSHAPAWIPFASGRVCTWCERRVAVDVKGPS